MVEKGDLLEALFGEKTAEQTLWQKVKSYISSVFKKKLSVGVRAGIS